MIRTLLVVVTLIVATTAFVNPSLKAPTKVCAPTSTALNLRVMINGMPGPMATAVAEACLRKGLTLAPYGLTGPDVKPQAVKVLDPDTGKFQYVDLINDREGLGKTKLAEMRAEKDDIVAIDYTHPSAVNENAQWYKREGLPFVMGTTGGDRDQLMNDVDGMNAVIAPNMGKQIVAMQRALENLERDFPSAFCGYKLSVTESHQKTKADTSGTAKAVIESINGLTKPGSSFDVETETKLIRDDEESIAFGVPPEHINGHAHHTYTLTSPDSTVTFQLQHNVNGRRVYAEGSADSVKFLFSKVIEGGEPKIYNMIDVLESGSMEDVIV